MTISTKLPLPEHNEESIFLGVFTVQRKYKPNKNSKKWITEKMVVDVNDPFVFKGISPYVILRRRGVLDRICRKTGWKQDQNITIIDIDFKVYLNQGCKEDLCEI